MTVLSVILVILLSLPGEAEAAMETGQVLSMLYLLSPSD